MADNNNNLISSLKDLDIDRILELISDPNYNILSDEYFKTKPLGLVTKPDSSGPMRAH